MNPLTLIGPWVVALVSTVALFTQSYPAVIEVALSQRGWNNNSAQPSRGCLDRLQKVVNVPHHCLVTVSVAMHTSQLGLRIQGLPLPDDHQLTRHASYVCGVVVDGN